MPITATFPTITFPHRGVQTQDAFVLAQETAQDLLAGSLTTNLNTFKTEANALEVNVNAKEASAVAASASAVMASNFQGTWTNQLTVVGQSWEYGGILYGVLVAGTASPITTPSNWVALNIASAIKNTPAGGISATTVQDALNELDTKKANDTAVVHLTGDETIAGIKTFSVSPVLMASLIFEGATADTFETTLTVVDPTTDNTLTLPNKSGTIATTADIIPTLLASYEVAGTAVSSIDFSGLDIQTHHSYRFEIDWYNPAATSGLNCYINGDTTATNYYSQMDQGYTTLSNGVNANAPTIGTCVSGQSSTVEGRVSLTSNNTKPRVLSTCGAYEGASEVVQTYGVHKTANATNITQLTFVSGTALALGVGTKIRIYRGDK